MPQPVSQLRLPEPPRRIALVKPSALGDIIHTLPVLAALKELFPAAAISWVVHSAYADLLVGHPDLDRVIRFDRGSWRRGWRSGWQATRGFWRELRQQPFDLVIDLQGLARSGLMTWLTRAPIRVGLEECREGSRLACTHLLATDPAAIHAVDRYWRVVTALGGGQLPKRFTLPRQPAVEAWAWQQLAQLPRPLLMVNLGTRWETKRWPVSHFVAVVRDLQARDGGTPVLLGGPGEELLAAQFSAELAGPTLNLAGQTTLPQLVSLVAQADLVLSNDSGPMHLAAALGRPVFAPFTCTDPKQHGPYGQMHHTACTTVACAASYLKQCGHLSCMTELVPQRLTSLALPVLSSWQKRSA